MTNLQFYQNCAIAAMQGIQEANSKLGVVSDFVPEQLSKRAFDIADAMMEEFNKRLARKPELKVQKKNTNG